MSPRAQIRYGKSYGINSNVQLNQQGDRTTQQCRSYQPPTHPGQMRYRNSGRASGATLTGAIRSEELCDHDRCSTDHKHHWNGPLVG